MNLKRIWGKNLQNHMEFYFFNFYWIYFMKNSATYNSQELEKA